MSNGGSFVVNKLHIAEPHPHTAAVCVLAVISLEYMYSHVDSLHTCLGPSPLPSPLPPSPVTQAEYEAEGIEWSSVTFIDNQECLDLIAKKPTGLLPLLDEECR